MERLFTKDLTVGLVGMDSVDDWEGEFPFGEIFCKASIRRILGIVTVKIFSTNVRQMMTPYHGALEVHGIIADLEICAKTTYTSCWLCYKPSST
jgi:hypothetical protein